MAMEAIAGFKLRSDHLHFTYFFLAAVLRSFLMDQDDEETGVRRLLL